MWQSWYRFHNAVRSLTDLVYFAEKVDGVDGDWWHKLCFKCNEPKCRKQLEPGNYSDHGGKLFCKRCYATQVKLQGYGYGNSLDSYRVKIKRPLKS